MPDCGTPHSAFQSAQSPLVHDHHAVRHFQCFFLVMRHQHARDVDLRMQVAQPSAQVLPHPRIQRAERFIQQQDAWLNGQSARQSDALSLSARKLRRVVRRPPPQLNQIQQFIYLARIASLEGRTLRGLTRSPNAIFSNTVICRNKA